MLLNVTSYWEIMKGAYTLSLAESETLA